MSVFDYVKEDDNWMKTKEGKGNQHKRNNAEAGTKDQEAWIHFLLRSSGVFN